ncbi:hypothetical protein E2G82_24760 [Salmonella enterica subsp. enterica serovar Ramatgan]|nr:hypothetical protein [Salmonella enterica subsp. enterica serovar Ramatgan]
MFRLLTPPVTKNNSLGMRKTACSGRGGLPAVWCVSVLGCASSRWRASCGGVCGGVGVWLRVRQISPDSAKTLLIPLKRYWFRQNNHGGSCSLYPAKTRHIPE